MRVIRKLKTVLWSVPVGLQLSGLYTVILVIVLAVLGTALYLQLDGFLISNTSNQIRNNTQTGLSRFVPFGRDGRPSGFGGPGNRTDDSLPAQASPQTEIAMNLVRALSAPDVNVAVLQPDGTVLARTESTLGGEAPYFPELPVGWQDITDTTLTGTGANGNGDTGNQPLGNVLARQWVLSGTGKGRYLVVVSPVATRSPDGRVSVPFYLEQVASLAASDAVLDQVRLYILIGILAGTVIGVAAGLALTRIVLRPLDRMVGTAEAIAGGDMDRRLRLPEGRNEVARLGGAFDHMVDRLSAALEAQRRFVADASHELRTPLTSLEGLSEMLLMGADKGDTQVVQRTVRSMYSELRRLSRLVTGLLTLSRMDSTSPLQLQVIDAGKLVDNVVEQLTPLAETKSVQLHTEHGPQVLLQADSDRLKQIIINLVDNAVRYTPPDGEVWVRALQDQPRGLVRLQVQDTGPGIAEADLPHIFDRFYRGDVSRSRATGNTGLGLAIAYAIAQAHGGSIDVQSPPGSGAIFTVTLPIGNVTVPAQVPTLQAVS